MLVELALRRRTRSKSTTYSPDKGGMCHDVSLDDAAMMCRLTDRVCRRYVADWRWLRSQYDGPWDRTEPIQTFIDTAFSNQEGRPCAVRARNLCSIVNNYLMPVPRGPRLTIKRHRRPHTATRSKRCGGIHPDRWWWGYVPEYLRPGLQSDPVWCAWFQRFVAVLGANPLRRNIVRTHLVHVHRVLRTALRCSTPGDLRAIGPEDLAQAVAEQTAGRPGQRRIARVAINRFVGEVVFRGQPLLAARYRLRSADIPRACEPPTHHPSDTVAAAGLVRDHFTPTEIASLLALQDLSPRDRCMLIIMAHTGLRRRAVSWLQTASVYDTAAGAVLPVCIAVEKGLCPRQFVLGDAARDIVGAYVRDWHPCPTRSRWLFPSPSDPTRPVSPDTVNAVLRRACRRAGISGRHCHSHGVRKYVICTLMSHPRNRLEDVAKWIGHRSIGTTFGTYWDATPTELAATMDIPWLYEHNP